MKRLTDKEINWMAFRYAATRTLALVAVIAMNVYAGFHGYDVRNWEWWAISPALAILITYVVVRLETK